MAQTPRVLTPEQSALHFFGSELRRRRVMAGLSQSELGQQMKYSGDLVRKVESAERIPSRAFVAGCDETLGSAGALLRLWPLLEREQRMRAVSDLGYRSDLPDRVVLDWLLAPDEPSRSPAINKYDVGAADDLRRLRDADHAHGAGVTYADVSDHIGDRVARLASGSPRLAIGYLELAGYGAVDLGADGVAQRHYLQALQIVSASAERVYGGYLIAVSLGHLALHCGDAEQAIRLATAAIHGTARRASPAVRAAFGAVLARAFARLGDEGACTAALHQVEADLSRSNPADEPEWISYFGTADLADEKAHCFFDLGHHRLAQAEVAEAMRLLEPHRIRRRAIDTALLASSLARSGEIEEACAAGRTAVDYAASMASFRSAHRIALMMAELHRHMGQRQVRELVEYVPVVIPELTATVTSAH
jgi:transcriptional regulator with XRE-family HTH domain